MIIAEWLFDVMRKLGKAGVDSPRRDGLVLLEDTLQKDRSWVLAHSDYPIPAKKLDQVNRLIDRRLKREPLAYIRGKAWFYGRFFAVNEHVMIPRPESEVIIDFAKNLNPKSIVDIGTGSGCLAITIALELPGTTVMATDISPDALEVCRRNIHDHDVKITVAKAFLAENVLVGNTPDLLIANLPYVPDDFPVSPEVGAEPKIAIYSGKDGMDLYESLWAQISSSQHKPLYVITESLESQHTPMINLAVKAGYHLDKTTILIQQFTRTS